MSKEIRKLFREKCSFTFRLSAQLGKLKMSQLNIRFPVFFIILLFTNATIRSKISGIKNSAKSYSAQEVSISKQMNIGAPRRYRKGIDMVKKRGLWSEFVWSRFVQAWFWKIWWHKCNIHSRFSSGFTYKCLEILIFLIHNKVRISSNWDEISLARSLQELRWL